MCVNVCACACMCVCACFLASACVLYEFAGVSGRACSCDLACKRACLRVCIDVGSSILYIYCFFTSTVTLLLLIPTCCYLVLPVTEFIHSMNKLTLFSQIFVFCLSLNVFLSHPFHIPIHTFKVLAPLHTVPKTIMSYNYITLNLVKFISLTFLWVLFLTQCFFG